MKKMITCLALVAVESVAAQSIDMQSATKAYFAAEKVGMLLKILFGVLCVAIAAITYRKYPFGRGLAYPLLIIAAIQFVVGGMIYWRTDTQVTALLAQLNSEPVLFYERELVRTQSVLSRFVLFRSLQIGLATAGAVLFAASRWKSNEVLQGVGIGLLATGLCLLVMDLFAAWRAETYFEALRKFSTSSVRE